MKKGWKTGRGLSTRCSFPGRQSHRSADVSGSTGDVQREDKAERLKRNSVIADFSEHRRRSQRKGGNYPTHLPAGNGKKRKLEAHQVGKAPPLASFRHGTRMTRACRIRWRSSAPKLSPRWTPQHPYTPPSPPTPSPRGQSRKRPGAEEECEALQLIREKRVIAPDSQALLS